jgi:hypothetical protein
MRVLSYSLFGNDGRYWNMVWPTVIINYSLYNRWTTRIHISSSEQNHPYYEGMQKLADRSPYFQINVHEGSFQNLEGTFWRLKPLWDGQSEYVFCKDLDSMPTSIELKAMWRFMCTGHIIHGIRSHPCHTINLMAGLCGFNCHALRSQKIMQGGYERYVQIFRQRVGKFDWGCDQRALADFFHGGEAFYLQRHTVDTPTRDAPLRISGYNPILLANHEYDFDLQMCGAFATIDMELMNWIDSKIRYEGMAFGIQGDDYNFIRSRNSNDELRLIHECLTQG